MKQKLTFAGLYAAIMLGWLLPAPVSSFAAANLTDVQAKLVILHTFVGQYTRWPGSYSLDRNQQVNICSIGRDAVTQQLGLLEKASTNTLEVHVKQQVSPSHIQDCHVLYIAESEKLGFAGLLKQTQGYPVLTVSAIRNFVEEGGMVGLETDVKTQGNFEKHFVRYALNSRAVSAAGLSVEADSMELAKRVIH